MGKKGFTQGELNVLMKRKGLYARWVQLGMSNYEALRLLLNGRPLPENTRREDVNKFLAYLIHGKTTRSMRQQGLQ